MDEGVLVLYLLFTFGLSWLNAWTVGHAWVETKEIGGFSRFVAWCGAVMSACGFTWVYLILLAVGAHAFLGMPIEYVEAMLNLGYLLVIGPILGSGLGLTLNSWAYFARRRDWRSGGIAGWNTFAQGYNTYQAVSAIPDALASVLDVLLPKKGSSKDGVWIALVVLLVIAAVAGGSLTTSWIIKRTARSDARRLYTSETRYGYRASDYAR